VNKNKSQKTYSAIDLYSGIGGWSLGFEIAGITISSSYEWWKPANKTHQSNLGANTQQVDIRELSLNELPTGCDFVVGSPPCTQFSYSNRGGSGDIDDGLRDVRKFLEVVKYLEPKYWAMENVPRVAKILTKEISSGGCLEEFSDIMNSSMIHVIDFSEFGLPQKRKRCVAGNFDYGLLDSYKSKCRLKTLGDVINALSEPIIQDPNFRLSMSSNEITELDKEDPLNWEELRFNRDAKTYHTVYNNMEFPDPFDKPVRTVTATCTRVSRESIIVEDNRAFRRLSVRERGCLQGFPINFEFLGKSYSSKLKMIGNSIPPVFTYYIANAMIGTPLKDLTCLEEKYFKNSNPKLESIKTKIDTAGKTYPKNRSFRFAIPNLRFKSGTRFELSNNKGLGRWHIKFYFGDSKRILSVELNNLILDKVLKLLGDKFGKSAKASLTNNIPLVDHSTLQGVWSGRMKGEHPFSVLDELGQATNLLISLTKSIDDKTFIDAVKKTTTTYDDKTGKPIAEKKLEKYAREITVGLLVGSKFNTINDHH
jgi:DNA (cytosine-5)-methyltransferase 1